MNLKMNEAAAWTLIIAAICAVLIAMALGSKGCNESATIRCSDGTHLSKEGWGERMEYSPEEAEHFCAGHGGVAAHP